MPDAFLSKIPLKSLVGAKALMKLGDLAQCCRRPRAPLRRGQVSMEYMLVVGFMFALLIPLLILYARTQQDTTDSLSQGQVIRAGNTIRDVAERVYFAGAPSQETISILLPDTITDSRIDNTTMIFTLVGAQGDYDVAVSGLAPLNGTLPDSPGRHVLIVRAETAQVRIIPS